VGLQEGLEAVGRRIQVPAQVLVAEVLAHPGKEAQEDRRRGLYPIRAVAVAVLQQ